MPSKVEKMSISLPPETLAQLDYLREHLFKISVLRRSTLIQMCISKLYFECLSSENMI